MRSLIRLGFIAAAVAFGYGSAHAVQGPPPGTYRASCANLQMRNWTLYANCQDVEGRWRSAVLPYVGDCVGDVSNINGQLRCERRAGWRERDSLPRGSYVETCREIRLRGNFLTARCQSMSGRWMRSSLNDIDGCIGEVVNDDGQLQCGRRGWQGAGSYMSTCAPIYVRGDDLRARCQAMDGRWVWSTLDGFERCGGRIVNINGQLRCGDRDRDDWDGDGDRERDWDRDRDRDNERGRDSRLPRGTYAQTCQSIEMRGDRLHARCQTMDGRWNWTDLDDVFRCRGDITNINGRLVCSR